MLPCERKYQNLRIKINREIRQLEFLTSCKNMRLMPNFLRIKVHSLGTQDYKIIKHAEIKRLRAFIRVKRSKIRQWEGNMEKALNEMNEEMSQIESANRMETVKHLVIRQNNTGRVNLNKKLWNLMNEVKINEKENSQIKPLFINKTGEDFNHIQIRALERGQKYAYPMNVKSVTTLLPHIEQIVKKLPYKKQEPTRFKIYRALTKMGDTQKTVENTRIKYEKSELMDIRNNPELKIVEADKSKQLIIMKNNEFKEKMFESIKNLGVIEVKNDPNNGLIRKLAEFRNHSLLPEIIKKEARPPIGSTTPCLFGKLKTHKDNQPIRPIVAKATSPTINLEKALFNFLKNEIEPSKYCIRNAIELIDRLKAIKTNLENTILVSLDVVSLFPSTPVKEAIELIEKKLEEKAKLSKIEIDEIIRALNFVTNSTFFRLYGKIFKQEVGGPMGSPLSGFFADIIMEDIELNTIATMSEEPLIYCRFVDDIFVHWQHGMEKLKQLKEKMSSIYPTIKLTMEIEKNKILPFLDLEITRLQNGLAYRVYRKDTYVECIIPADSEHPLSHKLSAFRAYIQRAKTHSSNKKAYTNEMNWIYQVAKQYGYKTKIIKNLEHQIENNRKELKENKIKKFIGSIPYVKEINQILNKVTKNENLGIGIKTVNINKILVNNRDKIENFRKPGVYEIPIINKQNKQISKYIGSTKRSMIERLKEHDYDWRKGKTDTALLQFCKENECYPGFENAKLLATFDNERKIRLAESFFIEQEKDKVCNISEAIGVPLAWRMLIGEQVDREKEGNKRKKIMRSIVVDKVKSNHDERDGKGRERYSNIGARNVDDAYNGLFSGAGPSADGASGRERREEASLIESDVIAGGDAIGGDVNWSDQPRCTTEDKATGSASGLRRHDRYHQEPTEDGHELSENVMGTK